MLVEYNGSSRQKLVLESSLERRREVNNIPLLQLRLGLLV